VLWLQLKVSTIGNASRGNEIQVRALKSHLKEWKQGIQRSKVVKELNPAHILIISTVLHSMLAKEVEHQTNQDSELDPRLIVAHQIVTLAAFHTLNNVTFQPNSD
jgi:hypothetical protein